MVDNSGPAMNLFKEKSNACLGFVLRASKTSSNAGSATATAKAPSREPEESKMFSDTAWKLLRRSIQMAALWSTLPIKWNGQSGRVEIVKSKWRSFLWLFNFLGLTLHGIFVLTRYIQLTFLNSTTNMSLQAYMEYLAIAYTIPWILYLTMFWRFREFIDFINEYMSFHKILNGITGERLSIGRDCDRFLKFMWRSGHCINCGCLVAGYLNPSRPNLLSSLFVEAGVGLRLWHRILLLAPHIWMWLTIWAFMHVLALHSVGSVYMISSSAAQLREMARGRRQNRENMAKYCSLYRALQVLHIQHGISFGPPLAAHKVPFALLIIRSIYGALTGKGIVRVLQAIVGLCTWLYLHLAFRLLGKVHETSEEALKELSSMQGNRQFQRFLKSCRPLKVSIAGLYHVDKGMPLTLAATIMERIVDLVIAGK